MLEFIMREKSNPSAELGVSTSRPNRSPQNRHFSRRVFSSAIVVILGLSFSHGQWQQLNGPFDGYGVKVLSIVATNGAMFACAEGIGIFRSTNKGDSWSNVTPGLPSSDVSCAAANSIGLFCGLKKGGVYRSTDLGQSWQSVNSGLTSFYINSLTTNGSSVFVGTLDGGVFRSSDNGGSWNETDEGLSGFSIGTLAANDSLIVAGCSVDGVYVARTSDMHWKSVSAGLSSLHVSSVSIHDSRIAVGTANGVYCSSDVGAHWTKLLLPAADSLISMVQLSDSSLTIGTESDGAWIVSNHDTVGIAKRFGLASNGIESILFLDDRIIVGTIGDGVYVQLQNDTTWGAANVGIGGAQVSCVTVLGTRILAGTVSGRIYRSDNGGAQWEKWTIEDSLWPGDRGEVRGMIRIGSKLAAGTAMGVFVSSDSGTSWTRPYTWEPWYHLSPTGIRDIAGVGDAILATDYNSVFLSGDFGKTWRQVFVGANLFPPHPIASFGGNTVLAGPGLPGSAGAYVSSDTGASWFPIVIQGLANGGLTSFGSLGEMAFATSQLNGLFRSSDNGNSWAQVQLSGLAGSTLTCLLGVKDRLYAGTTDGVSYSLDDGATWFRFGDSLERPIACLSFDSSYLYAATDRGVWRITLSGATSSPELSVLPGTHPFELRQSFPNPCNPSTTISYILSRATEVRLEIFNGIGQRIALLDHGKKDPGFYEVSFDGTMFAAGVYFYRLSTPTQSQVGSMVLLK